MPPSGGPAGDSGSNSAWLGIVFLYLFLHLFKGFVFNINLIFCGPAGDSGSNSAWLEKAYCVLVIKS